MARALAALAGLRLAAAWRTWGTLPASDIFAVYAGKFCFDFKRGTDVEAGRFQFSLAGHVLNGPHETSLKSTEGPPCWGPCETQGNLYLLVFDDEEDHWQRVHGAWESLTCEEMLHYASFAMPLSPLSGALNRTVYVHESLRPRFWYFTFAACGVRVVAPVHYEIHAENILQGAQAEFGIDERGSWQLQALSCAAFAALGLSLRQMARRATGAEALRSRPLLRMLILSALASAAGALCLALHFTAYAFNGYGLALLEVLGRLWLCGAKALLTLLQLLTAKGWALFYAPEELAQRQFTLAALGGVVLLSTACEVHADYFRDWSTALYLYESWPGLLILLLNCALFAEAWRSMRETYRHESSEEVRLFYLVVSAACAVYFLSLPATCALAAAFSPWVRAKYVARAEAAARLLATLLLAFCLRPSRLDAMVNARLEEGLGTVGEPQEAVCKEEGLAETEEGPGSGAESGSPAADSPASPLLREEAGGAEGGPAE